MAKNVNEIDYSLSYDEYLENFRKTHHPQAIAMSKDQFELEKAKRDAQKKREAAREAGTAEGALVYQKGPSDETVEKITGKVDPSHEEVMDAVNEKIERRITPDQQGIQSKGNKVAIQENIDDTRAIGATKEELDYMLYNGLISKDAYEKQIAALNTPEVQEKMGLTPKENDTPKEAEAKGKYNKSMMSIWDAYRAGDIDKETAGYFTIDAIATLAKNLGRSIGNVGAQFSGGTIDNGHDTSMWEQRRDSMFNTELQKETEGVDTFENKFKQLSYNRNSTINDLIVAVKSDADKLSDDNPLKIAYLSLAAMIASGQVDGTTTLAATGAKGITELFNLFKRKGKDKK